MANLAGFDARKVEPNSFEALPAGEYQVILTDSNMKTTKSGDGQYLELKMQVMEGQHKGRTLFDRLNLVNKNQMAAQIAQGTLSSICRAVNVLSPNDSAELHNKPLTAVVRCRKDGSGEIRNEVKGYKPRQANMLEQAFSDDKPAATKKGKTPF